jgi:hypothetical protein
MFYAANIPVIDDRLRAERCFQHGFKVHVLNGVRPHLLYGTSESKGRQAPQSLPPMQNSFYDQLDPLKGNLTVPSDRAKIEELYENLRPYFKTVSKVGYEGSRDSNGKMSGKGIFYRSDDGAVYDGEWLDGLGHGLGVQRFAWGDIYEGEYRAGKMSGHGKYRFADGSVYEGGYLNGLMSGYGIYRYYNGDIYEGGMNGLFSGYGICCWADGRVYEGQWLNGKKSGHGVMRGADGTIIQEGRYLDGKYVGIK